MNHSLYVNKIVTFRYEELVTGTTILYEQNYYPKYE